MTQADRAMPVDPRPAVVLARGCGWGAVGGAACGALFTALLLIPDGPLAAVLVYPPLAAIPGAVVGLLVGAATATVLAFTHGLRVRAVRLLAATVSAAGVAWAPLLWVDVGRADGAWHVLVVVGLAAGAGALLGPRVSARPNGAAAATGTASPGSSRAPGR